MRPKPISHPRMPGLLPPADEPPNQRNPRCGQSAVLWFLLPHLPHFVEKNP
jgi:hypothetical protein